MLAFQSKLQGASGRHTLYSGWRRWTAPDRELWFDFCL